MCVATPQRLETPDALTQKRAGCVPTVSLGRITGCVHPREYHSCMAPKCFAQVDTSGAPALFSKPAPKLLYQRVGLLQCRK